MPTTDRKVLREITRELDLRKGDDVLMGAADLIEKEGWIQHDAHTHDGYCIAGAVMALSVHGGVSACNAMKILAEYLGFKDNSRIIDWNDGENRTREEVLTAMRTAANLRRKEHHAD